MKDSRTLRATFGDIMRTWRKRRRFSQLALALRAGISPRHLSFLESGRSEPSREMVHRLADSLDIPRPDVNRALLSAGYAPVYHERDRSDADLAPVHEAIKILLHNHMPYPALVMDRYWNITAANDAAGRLLEVTGFAGHTSLLAALAAQTPEESSILNWSESIAAILLRLQAELSILGDDPVLEKLAGTLQAHFDKYGEGHVLDRSQAILPTRFRIDGQVISTFSTLAQFGTVQDIALHDLKVELMFPMDAESEACFRA